MGCFVSKKFHGKVNRVVWSPFYKNGWPQTWTVEISGQGDIAPGCGDISLEQETNEAQLEQLRSRVCELEGKLEAARKALEGK